MPRILRGALTRFLPTVVAVLGIVGGTAAVTTGVAPTLAGLGMAAAELAGLTLGYAGSLALVRRRLRDDAGVDGRRGIVAGVAAVLALAGVSWMVQGVTPARALLLSAATSGAVTLALYAPWLRRARERSAVG